MQQAVVDTNVVSFIIKNDSRSHIFIPHLTGKDLTISFATLAELDHWALIRNWSQRRRDKLHENLGVFFAIHHSDAKLCQKWADIVYQSRQEGKTISSSDAWIAATAVVLGMPLITHNRKDFEHVADLTLISD